MPQVIIVGLQSDHMDNIVSLTESHGFTIHCAYEGQEAIESIAEDTRLIITESVLPEYPGHEFVALISNDPTLPTKPPVMLWDTTSETDDDLAAKGFDGRVPRSPTLDWFREFIHDHIRE